MVRVGGMTSAEVMAAPPEDPRRNQADPRTALAGVPNCGKTALFNALTGARQKVANYAGVKPVELSRKKMRRARQDDQQLAILDLPGTYSLRAYSPDGAITKDAVLGAPDEQRTPRQT